MSLFVLDTAGDHKLTQQSSLENVALTKNTKRKTLDEKIINKIFERQTEVDTNETDDDYFGLPPPNVDISDIISSTLSKRASAKNEKSNQALEEINLSVDAALQAKTKALKKPRNKRVLELDHSDFNVKTGKFDDEQLLKTNIPKVVNESRLKPGLEQLKEQPSLSDQKLRRINRLERAKTKGGDWYNLPATEMTEELQNELKILQMRSVLDPKHFYKKNDLKVLPKYFQIGTVLPSPLDHYKERDTRKNKKRSLVDELLADTEFQSFNKRKYNEAMARKNKYAQRKVMKKMKKLKKNK